MKTTLALVLLLCAPQAAPEEPKIAELIRALGSEKIQERDQAQKELLEAGKAALPQLRKATEDPDAERRSRVRALIAKIEWTPLQSRPVMKDLSDEERKFLGEVGLMTLSNPHPLILSLEAQGSQPDFAEPSSGRYKDEIWSFLRADLFEEATVKGLSGARPTKGSSKKYFEQRTMAAGSLLLTLQTHFEHVVRGPSGILAHKYLPYALLETREAMNLSPASLAWDAEAGAPPCLKRWMVSGPKNVVLKRTKIFEKDGKISGAYYQFDWDGRSGKMETLRHLFVKEHWALFVVFTW